LIDLRLLRKVSSLTSKSVPQLHHLVERRVSSIRELSKYIDARSPVVLTATVVDRIIRKGKNLLLLDIGLPALLDVDREPIPTSEGVHSTLDVSPISVDRKAGIVWVSMKQADANKLRGKFIERINVGDIVCGFVSHIDSKFILADIENQPVYVPGHELAWQHPPIDPADGYQIGDRVQLRITQIDVFKAKVSGSIRRAKSHPLHDGTVREGMTFVGYVHRFQSFGAFVMLPNGLVGLLHQSRIFSRKIGRYYPSVKKIFALYDEVEVIVDSIDVALERIELSLVRGPMA
jgi:ribosomal protein S1